MFNTGYLSMREGKWIEVRGTRAAVVFLVFTNFFLFTSYIFFVGRLESATKVGAL